MPFASANCPDVAQRPTKIIFTGARRKEDWNRLKTAIWLEQVLLSSKFDRKDIVRQLSIAFGLPDVPEKAFASFPLDRRVREPRMHHKHVGFSPKPTWPAVQFCTFFLPFLSQISITNTYKNKSRFEFHKSH